MEGKKNDMYSRAAKMRDGSWNQIEITEPAAMPAEMANVPEIMLPSVMAAQEEDGYCFTLAMSYTPIQRWEEVYEAETGFDRGTIFPELDLPFLGGACNDE